MPRPNAKRLLRAGCAGLLLAFAPCAFAAPPADAAAWMGVKGATAELIGEKVFDGRVMLYRAGKRGGEPVLLVHGLGPNGARDWSKVVPALAPAYDVYALDLPGFGRSDKGNQLYSPENLARVIEDAVAPRVGKPFVLVGHSMGAAVSLAYAAAYPQRVRRLVLTDMAGVLHGSVYAQSVLKVGLGQLGGNFPAEAPWVDSLMRGVLAKIENMPVSREMVLRTPALRQQLMRGDPGMIAAFALGEQDFSEALRQITAPTLLIWGGEDQLAPLRTGQLAHALIAGSRLEIIAGAAHTPQLEDPERFNAALLEELGELRVLESDVQVWNSEIRGGLYALRSRVQVTAGSIGGEPALRLDEAELDVAGTRFESIGPVAANVGTLPLNLRLSVVEVRRPDAAPRYFHDSVRIGAGISW